MNTESETMLRLRYGYPAAYTRHHIYDWAILLPAEVINAAYYHTTDSPTGEKWGFSKGLKIYYIMEHYAYPTAVDAIYTALTEYHEHQ